MTSQADGASPRRPRPWITVFAAACAALPAAAGTPPIAQPIVFVKQQPIDYTFATASDIFGNFQGYYPPEDQPVGGNLFRLDPTGTLANLTDWNNAAVRDPEISPDATRVLFSMKLGGFGKYQVWEMNVDGTSPRRVSLDDTWNDLDPAYLPDGRIVFTTDRNGWADGYENLPAAQLAVMDADGTDVEVLKQHMAGQFNPLLGSDGMLYFTQWDFHDRRASIGQNNSDFDVNRFLLWKVFADGSGLDHPSFGAHTLYDFAGGHVELRELPGQPGTFLGLLADEFFTFGGGSIVLLTPQANQNLDEPVFVTEDVFMVEGENTAGRWRSPYPLADGRVVAGYSPGPVFDGSEPAPAWRLVVMEADGSQQQEIYHDPQLWSWQPVEVVSRTQPPLAAGASLPQFPYAIINALDVTLRGINENDVLNGDFQPPIDPGEAQQVRVLRENLRTANFYNDFPDHDDPDVEVLGTAPIHADGSFAVVVPRDVPIQWELLDAGGEVLVRERFGTELKSGELRQCGGCHTPHDGGTGNTTNLALAAPTNLSGEAVDQNGNGIVDLLEHLQGGRIFLDGFESGDLSAWSTEP